MAFDYRAPLHVFLWRSANRFSVLRGLTRWFGRREAPGGIFPQPIAARSCKAPV